MTAAIGLALRILFLLALYLFLARALRILWKSVSSRDTTPGVLRIPSVILNSTEEGSLKTRQFSSAEILIGRDPDCDFVLSDSTVSARHGRLSFHQNQWWYEDLNSTNGSYLGDLRIEEPIVLKDGDELNCGEVIINFHVVPIE